MNNLAVTYKQAGKLDRAVSMFEELLPLLKSKLGPDHPKTLIGISNLADACQAVGRLDRAVSLLAELATFEKQKAGADSPRYSGALATLGLAQLRVKQWSEAEATLREALSIREAKEPDDWKTFNTKSLLGGALLGQKKFDEAGSLLRSGYEGMKQRLDKIPPQAKTRPGEALDRLIELAEATNKPDEAKVWREEKTKLVTTPSPEAKKP